MRANELMIGNYLKYKKGHLCKAVSISSNNIIDVKGLKDSYINGTYNTRDLQPIPLTEEWLLKFGFYQDADKSYLFNKMAIFLDKRFKFNLYLQTEETSSKWFEIGLRVKHVHQLQNLYHALTGEELKIKQND